MKKLIKGLALGATGLVIGGGCFIVGEQFGYNEKPAIESPAPGGITSADVEKLQTQLDEFKTKLASAEASLKIKDEALQKAEADASVDKDTIAQLRQDKESSINEISNLQQQIKNLELQIETELVIDLTQLMPWANRVYRQRLDTGILFSPDTNNGGLWFYSFNTKQLNKIYESPYYFTNLKNTPGGCFAWSNDSNHKFALVFEEQKQEVKKIDLVDSTCSGGWGEDAIVLENGIVLSGFYATNYIDFETLSNTTIFQMPNGGTYGKQVIQLNGGCLILGDKDKEGFTYFDEATKTKETISTDITFTKVEKLSKGCLLYGYSNNANDLIYYFKQEDKSLNQVSDNFNVQTFCQTENGCLVGGNTENKILLFDEETITAEELSIQHPNYPEVRVCDIYTIANHVFVKTYRYSQSPSTENSLFYFVKSNNSFTHLFNRDNEIYSTHAVGTRLFVDIASYDANHKLTGHQFGVLYTSGIMPQNQIPESDVPYEFRDVDEGVLIIQGDIAYLYNTSTNKYSLYGYID